MRRWVLLLALAVAGCGHGAAVGSVSVPTSPAWTEPASYSYTVDSRCGERFLIGRVRLTVTAGQVTAAVGLDEAGRTLTSAARLESYPSLGDLLGEYEWARAHRADVARATYDPTDGHPTRIELDPQRNGVDDEACYTITDYAPA